MDWNNYRVLAALIHLFIRAPGGTTNSVQESDSMLVLNKSDLVMDRILLFICILKLVSFVNPRSQSPMLQPTNLQ